MLGMSSAGRFSSEKRVKLIDSPADARNCEGITASTPGASAQTAMTNRTFARDMRDGRGWMKAWYASIVGVYRIIYLRFRGSGNHRIGSRAGLQRSAMKRT